MLSIFSNSGKIAYGVKQYILDTIEDMDELTYMPAAGSTAYIISTNEMYICNSQGIWTKYEGSGSTGGGGDSSSGTTGPQGPAGESAYEIAVRNGFTGTEEEWLDSLSPQIEIGENKEWYVDGEATGVKAQVSNYDDLENKPTVDGEPIDELETIDEEDILSLFPQD